MSTCLERLLAAGTGGNHPAVTITHLWSDKAKFTRFAWAPNFSLQSQSVPITTNTCQSATLYTPHIKHLPVSYILHSSHQTPASLLHSTHLTPNICQSATVYIPHTCLTCTRTCILTLTHMHTDQSWLCIPLLLIVSTYLFKKKVFSFYR